jgi:hypothetical protein
MRSYLTNVLVWATFAAVWFAGCSKKQGPSDGTEGGQRRSNQAQASPATRPAAPDAAEAGGWKRLFDGRSLDGWIKSDYVASPDPKVQNGVIVLPMGEILTGITYTKNLPNVNYEVTLEAMRTDGHDFFCGLTFPFHDRHATLVCSGWGGSVTGISSIDGRDASENETTRGIDYEDKKWYRIRLRVEPARIRAWIHEADKPEEKEPTIDVDTTDKKIDIREDIAASKPFGIATYRTTAHLRDIRLREIDGE